MKRLVVFFISIFFLFQSSLIAYSSNPKDFVNELVVDAITKLADKNLNKDQKIIFGNSLYKIKNIEGEINYCVTSPPYHNILRNKGNGIRDVKDNYRKGARTGVEYYSENKNDLGNQKSYQNFLDLFVIEAKLKTKNDIWIYLNADKGTFNQSSGEIFLESNIEIYTEADEKIFAEIASVSTNSKIITLKKNVKYQDSNIFISADKSIINDELSNITYYGNVKSKILKNKLYE